MPTYYLIYSRFVDTTVIKSAVIFWLHFVLVSFRLHSVIMATSFLSWFECRQMDMATYYQKVLLAWMLWEKVFPRRRRSRGRQEMDMIGWLELSWCRKCIWLVDWSCRDRDKAIVRGGMVYGLCKWWPFHHTIFGPHTLNRLITISPWTWHKFCQWPHESQMDMVTSFLRAFSLWVALVEKVPPLGSNASCDDPSSMASSSGESREQFWISRVSLVLLRLKTVRSTSVIWNMSWLFVFISLQCHVLSWTTCPTLSKMPYSVTVCHIYVSIVNFPAMLPIFSILRATCAGLM